MTQYISYYSFFSENLKIIKDVKSDFSAEGIVGNEFDKAYKSFLHKFISRCHSFAGESFRGQSHIISNYITEIANTETVTQSNRFSTLISITEFYVRNTV